MPLAARELSEQERAYVAGILDGEGCLGVGWRLKKYVTPTVQVSNTKVELLHWLSERFGGAVYEHAPREGNRQACYLWTLAGTKALRVIEAALPYLVIKREQARLLLSMRRIGKGYRMKPDDVLQNSRLVTEIHRLNRRGAG